MSVQHRAIFIVICLPMEFLVETIVDVHMPRLDADQSYSLRRSLMTIQGWH